MHERVTSHGAPPEWAVRSWELSLRQLGPCWGQCSSLDRLQSLSPLLLWLLRENQERNQRENILRCSHWMNHTANLPWMHEDEVCIFCTGWCSPSAGAAAPFQGSTHDGQVKTCLCNCVFWAASEHLHVDCNTLLPICGMVCATRAMFNGPQSKIRSSLLPYHALLLSLLLTLWASVLTPICALLHYSEAEINSLLPLCNWKWGSKR